MIRIRCRCGEVFHAEEQHVGRVLHCRCGRSIPVRIPPPGAVKSAAAPARPGGIGAVSRRLRERVRLAVPGVLRVPASVVRWLAWAAWGYFGVVLLVWAAMWALGERWWPATVYLFGPRWVLLTPLALLLPAALLLRRRLVLPLLASALVMLFPVMGLRLGWRALLAGEASGPVLRVVTLNAAGKANVPGWLLPLLSGWRPDLVAVQECSRQVAEGFEAMPGWTQHREGKLCLLSRHPVLRVEPWEQEAGFGSVREAGIGGSSAAVRYTIDTPGGPVRLVNLHLETPRRGLEGIFRRRFGRIESNSITREIESRQVAAWAREGEGPLLVAGDFNLPVESRIYRESWGGLRNAFSDAGRGFGFTRDNGWIQVRIDHVLAGPGWRVRRAWVGPDVGSDHRPVVAELELEGGR